MTASNRRTVVAATLAIFAAALHTAPAGAMGRSGTRSVQPPAVDRLGRVEAEQKNIETALQAQVEALRQELADLKARMALQGVAYAD